MAPEDLLALARALNTPAPLDLRVNSLKAEPAAVIKRLAADGIVAVPCPYSPLGLRLKTKPFLQKHPAFLDGSFEVQDEGSQLLGFLLAPKRGEMVVDFCAGAGGKTLLLGAMMRSTGRLYAYDVSDKRLAKMKPRAARAGLSNVHPACLSGENDSRVKRLSGKADRVLVDAPCSGLGTLRRNPDLKWRQIAAKRHRTVRQAGRHPCRGGAPGDVRADGWCMPPAASSPKKTRKSSTPFLPTMPGFRGFRRRICWRRRASSSTAARTCVCRRRQASHGRLLRRGAGTRLSDVKLGAAAGREPQSPPAGEGGDGRYY